MARNKHPEQTLEKIVETAAQLFVEKGYEQTSIQDILDVSGLSKGGLYHHFKSKEQIFGAVMEKRILYVNNLFHELIRDTQGENAREKLKKILYRLAIDTKTHSLDQAVASHVEPYLIVGGMQGCVLHDAPIIAELIQKGNEDGSLQVDQPELCAEIFLILLNYWTNPVLFSRKPAETKARLDYLQTMMKKLGLDILDDALIAVLLKTMHANSCLDQSQQKRSS